MACNPSTRRSIGRAKTVVLTEDLTITGATTGTVNFKPALYGPGSPYQNVDVLPTAGHVVVLMPGTTTPGAGTVHGINGLALNRDAFALVSVKMEEPKAVEVASTQRDPKTGIAISFVRQFEGRTRTMINRFDVLMGFGDLYPENCSVRVASLL
jgi:predicted phage tail protein